MSYAVEQGALSRGVGYRIHPDNRENSSTQLSNQHPPSRNQAQRAIQNLGTSDSALQWEFSQTPLDSPRDILINSESSPRVESMSSLLPSYEYMTAPCNQRRQA